MRTIEPASNARLPIRIRIGEDALRQIERESSYSPRTETGGVVAGIENGRDGEVIITHASGPGPEARRSPFHFQHDRIFCQEFLDSLARKTSGRIDYLGEWHKHFESDPRPSGTDIKTLRKIVSDNNYHVSLPLLLIIGQSNVRASLKVWIFNNSGNFVFAEWASCVDGDFELLVSASGGLKR